MKNVTGLAVYAIIHCLGYLRETRLYVRVFYYSSEAKLSLVAFTDANWANNKKTRKSMGGNFIFLGPSLVHSKCKVQKNIATSSAAAELAEMFSAGKTIDHIFQFCKELEVPLRNPAILTDSISSVNTLEKPLQKAQKHLGVYIHYLRELNQRIGLKLLYICRKYNIADLNNKHGAAEDFVRLIKLIKGPYI